MTSLPKPVELLGVKIHPVTKDQLVETLVDWALNETGKRAYYVNAHALNLAHDNVTFRDLLNGGDLVYCDGYGAQWGARFVGQVEIEKLTVMDWVDMLLHNLSQTDASVYLVGDEPGVAELCGARMEQIHPGLQLAGTHHGFFELGGQEERAVIERVRQSEANVLMLGMGMPRQETWIGDHAAALQCGLFLPVGAMLRWYSGTEHRPPEWMSSRGLEWLGRLARHPVRNWRRYVEGNPRYMARLIRARWGIRQLKVTR